MGKEVKTNAVRILERNKVPYELLTYECDEFIDGIHSAINLAHFSFYGLARISAKVARTTRARS